MLIHQGQVPRARVPICLCWIIGGTGDGIDLHNGTDSVLDFPAAAGTYQVVFNAANTTPGTWIAQTFDTVAGHDYVVTFQVARLGAGSGGVSILASASYMGQALGYVTVAPPAHGYGSPQRLVFTAAGNLTLLKFEDTSTATISVDVALDAVSVANFGPASDTLKIAAYIDGRSQLVIRPDGLSWNHLQYTRPGGGLSLNYPTYINGFAWYPYWPDKNDISAGVSGSLDVSLRFSANPVNLAATKARGFVSIVQQPAPSNNATLILDFDDPQNGAAFYDVELWGITASVLPVLSIQVSSVALSFPAELNQRYQLQFASGALSNWTNLGAPILGMGSNAVVNDSVLEQQSKVYRVVPIP